MPLYGSIVRQPPNTMIDGLTWTVSIYKTHNISSQADDRLWLKWRCNIATQTGHYKNAIEIFASLSKGNEDIVYVICDRDWRVGCVVEVEEAAFSDVKGYSTFLTPMQKESRLVCSSKLSESERIHKQHLGSSVWWRQKRRQVIYIEDEKQWT